MANYDWKTHLATAEFFEHKNVSASSFASGYFMNVFDAMISAKCRVFFSFGILSPPTTQ